MKPTAPKASLRAFFGAGWKSLTAGDRPDGAAPSGPAAFASAATVPPASAPAAAAPAAVQGGCAGNCSCGGQRAEKERPLGDLLARPISRRSALGHMLKGALAGVAAAAAPKALAAADGPDAAGPHPGSLPGASEAARLKFEEYLKGNYRLMTKAERKATVRRLERLAKLKRGVDTRISTREAADGVLFGYAFNISKCKGYMDCVKACTEENNHDRKSGIQYITIHEMKPGELGLHSSNKQFFHEVPADGHFYLGTQCFHCENPPCTKVCPVGATWKEKDGIVVIDYDWCIGCRYCEAACPYFGRRFNWNEPELPAAEINPVQHYLGNRPRAKGVMEKCTFCVQRSREGRQPACVEACPTGARVFGNLLDPKSEIRWVLANKKVFRFKEELGTEPKFWYYMD